MRLRGVLAGLLAVILAFALTGCGVQELLDRLDCQSKGQNAPPDFAGSAQAIQAVQASVGLLSPGITVALGTATIPRFLGGSGSLTWSGNESANPAKTLYDLASLTKVVATTAGAMALYDQGKLDLDAPLKQYWAALQGTDKADLTARQLLTHTSGLPLQQIRASSPAEAIQALIHMPLDPQGQVLYTNLSMVMLWEVMRQIIGGPPEKFVADTVWQPIGMCSTGFTPKLPCKNCAPGADGVSPGTASDPTAVSFGGVTGCAGLFSTATDIGRFAALMAGEGTIDGKTIFKPETVKLFTTAQAGTRALGWDTAGSGAPVPIPTTAAGHTGWTGTSILVDPASKIWAVVLTNYQVPGGSLSGNDGTLNTLRLQAYTAATVPVMR